MDVVQSLTADTPVVIFSKSNCGISYVIEVLIKGFGANFKVYKLDEMVNGQQLERALVEELRLEHSTPAVFIGNKFVGGSDEIISLHIQKKLIPMLKMAKAIWL